MIKKLISKEEIDKRLKEIGKTISFDYKDKEITIVVTLKGAFISMDDDEKYRNLPYIGYIE